MKKVLIAPDSFKGCLSAEQISEVIGQAVHAVCPDCQICLLPIADGGEGTTTAIVGSTSGRLMNVEVHDPLMRPIKAVYGITGDGKTAVLDLASASGLPLLSPNERNPWLTTTYGTGELLLTLLQREAGIEQVIIGLGGSATHDGGVGLLKALGYRFLDGKGEDVPLGGQGLKRIRHIVTENRYKEMDGCHFNLACDVTSPLCGLQGAAFIFSPQKGADEMMVKELDEGLYSFATVIKKKFGYSINEIPGSGAAGGAGGVLSVLLPAQIHSGIDCIFDAVGFDQALIDSDLVITGEGCIDIQTLSGKVLSGVSEHARTFGVPVLAVAGKVCLDPVSIQNAGFMDALAITPPEMPLEKALLPNVACHHLYETLKDYLKKEMKS